MVSCGDSSESRIFEVITLCWTGGKVMEAVSSGKRTCQVGLNGIGMRRWLILRVNKQNGDGVQRCWVHNGIQRNTESWRIPRLVLYNPLQFP